ncbi:NAD(P)-binding protein [Nemania sp. FL0916]|nr:NAD(P)-binding protein [Nemania sp. FL0916]
MNNTPPPFLTSTPRQRATVRATLRRQLFVVPPPVQDVDLKGKTAIVTGSSGGIGLECSRQLLDLGLSRLILAVRNEQKGQQAKTQLLENRQLSEDPIEVWKLDLLSYDSITAFAERAKTLDRLDIAVLNAGIFNQTFKLTDANPSKHEECIQVNVLSNTLLSILLLPILQPKSSSQGPGRLAVVSSDVSAFAKFKERDNEPLLPSLDNSEKFDGWERYCTSKLLGQLAISELAKRVDPSTAIITLPNPGLIYGTRLGTLPEPNIVDKIGSVIKRIFGRHVAVGTRTITASVVKFDAQAHGQYVEDGKLEPLAPYAYTPDGARVAKLLWSEMMEELSFAKVDDILKDIKPSS